MGLTFPNLFRSDNRALHTHMDNARRDWIDVMDAELPMTGWRPAGIRELEAYRAEVEEHMGEAGTLDEMMDLVKNTAAKIPHTTAAGRRKPDMTVEEKAAKRKYEAVGGTRRGCR